LNRRDRPTETERTAQALLDASDRGGTHQAFGPSDGSRAPIEDLTEHFVRFDERRAPGLAMRGNDLRVRIIVGRKGTGKSLYLRRLQADAIRESREAEIYAAAYEPVSPVTADVIKVCSWYSSGELVEKWMTVWNRAVLRALVSHILQARHLRKWSLEREILTDPRFLDLYPEFDSPHSIDSQFCDIIQTYNHKRALDLYLNNRKWRVLEHRLGSLLKDLPAICFYVDALDEHYHKAPRYWLMCQLGLFYQVLDFLSDDRFANRLHVIICVRDHVYAQTRETEHAIRYMHTPYIRQLMWNRETIRFFLEAKIRGMSDEFMMNPSDRSVEGWLGITKITNARRQTTETIESYLLRHTRLIPRDIVVLGNQLSDEVISLKAGGTTAVPEAVAREIVHSVAEAFALEQLNICANEIAVDMMPADAARRGYDYLFTGEGIERFSGGASMHNKLARELAELLGTVKTDRFSRQRLRSLEQRFRDKFGDEIDTITILWQNGLLGYIDGPRESGRAVFYDGVLEKSPLLPAGHQGYVLRPILIDAIPQLRGVGAPVDALA
jgi:hypothetical protein